MVQGISASIIKCPECRAQIDSLGFSRKATILGTFDLGFGHQEDATAETESVTYFCPVCCADLFETEEDAEAFLRKAADASFKSVRSK